MFKKAIKSKSKLRLALFGPSGSGKTYTSLQIATGIGGPIAVIDSERKSASKYADRFDFDVCDLEERTLKEYKDVLIAAAEAHYNVVIIDSMTHAWKELLADIDNIARAKYGGNTWSAWSEGTPAQGEFIDAILNFPGHIIATMRSKTEWITEKTNEGKSRPVRVGLAPEQGKGIEYEFDLLMEMNVSHWGTILKDRTGMYQDKAIEKPGIEFGKKLHDWMMDGSDIRLKKFSEAVVKRYRELGIVEEDTLLAVCKEAGIETLRGPITEDQMGKAIAGLEGAAS